MSWEDSEFDFESVLECDECPKPNFDDEDETVKEKIVKPKTVIIKDPELIVCDDPEYATIYCSYETTGRGRTAKTVISSMLYNNQKILISQDSKYIGDGVSIKQIGMMSVVQGLNLARKKNFKKVVIYTDLIIPKEKYIDSIDWDSEEYEIEFKRVLKIFEEYNIINISRKLNTIVIRMSTELLDNLRLRGKQQSKLSAAKKANDLAFKNRFK
jgi:hypothetical protein